MRGYHVHRAPEAEGESRSSLGVRFETRMRDSSVPQLVSLPPRSAGQGASTAEASRVSRGIEDRYADARVIAEQVSTPDPDGNKYRIRLVELESKHPYHRVEERLYKDDSGEWILGRQDAMAADHILVVLDEAVSRASLERWLADADLQLHSETGIPDGYLIHSHEQVTLDTVPRLLEAAASLGEQALIEPNYVYWHGAQPNDPRYSEQWALKEIRMPAVWEATQTTSSVVVAVFDTGTTRSHADLYDTRWINAAETYGNETDDDGNGFVDDRYGWNFYADNNAPDDFHGHGTHVHGIIGAVGNNLEGITGVGWHIQTLPIAFMGPLGHGFASDAASGLYYVDDFVSRGIPVRVTNHSWGGSSFSGALSNAFANTSSDILHVAAAGNTSFGGTNNDHDPFYPASFQLPNVISVGNSTSTGGLHRDSNYGASSVHLAAPGTDILSTILSGGYGSKTGTSMAAPHVAGVFALLMETFPEEPSLAIRDAVLDGVEPIGALSNVVASGGRLDAVGAVQAIGARLEHEPLSNVNADVPAYEVSVSVRPGASLLAEDGVRLYWDTSEDLSGVITNIMEYQGEGGFTSEIPGRPLGNRIYYWIEVEGGNGELVTDPVHAPDEVHTFDITFPVEVKIQGLPSTHGDVDPSYGSHHISWGTEKEFVSPRYTAPQGGVRWRNDGWDGAGSVPFTGSTNRFSARITQKSFLVWRWRRQFSLAETSEPAGIWTEEGWWDGASYGETSLTPTEVTWEEETYRFIGWWVDGQRQTDAGTRSQNPAVGIWMDRAHEAVAHYLPKFLDSDGDGLPDWWQMLYFGHLDYGADDDVDGDGFTNAQEYADRSDPTDPTSFPKGPAIEVLQLSSIVNEPGPWLVQAVVTDRVDIATVLLEWREPGADTWQTVRMDPLDSDADIYEGAITGINGPGVTLDYRVFAEDAAWNTSTSEVYRFSAEYPVLSVGGADHELRLAAGEEHVIRIGITNTGTRSWHWEPAYGYAPAVTDPPAAGWTSGGPNDQWHVSDREFVSSPYAWFCGDPDGGTYNHSMDASLYTPLIRLGAHASLRFMHWPEMEHDGRAGYENHYWDGAVVEMSTDGGGSFFSIEPEGGYPYFITPNTASPFEDHRPCFGGLTGGWHEAVFDLSAYDGELVQVRFRFGTDRWVEYRGWFVDDLSFSWQPSWLTSVSSGGSIEPGGSGWLEWRVDARDLGPGHYRSGWTVHGNAPEHPKVHGEVVLEVQPVPSGRISMQPYDEAETHRIFVLRWHSETGKVYSLQHGEDLRSGAWIGVPGYTNLPGGGMMSYTSRVDLVPRQFYRVLEEGP